MNGVLDEFDRGADPDKHHDAQDNQCSADKARTHHDQPGWWINKHQPQSDTNEGDCQNTE